MPPTQMIDSDAADHGAKTGRKHDRHAKYSHGHTALIWFEDPKDRHQNKRLDRPCADALDHTSNGENGDVRARHRDHGADKEYDNQQGKPQTLPEGSY